MIITEPGIYPDVSNEDYHNSRGISSSGLGLLLPPNCPKTYWYRFLSGQYVSKRNDSLILGTAVHTLALEPKTLDSRFLVADIPYKTKKDYELLISNLLLEANGREIIKPDELELAQHMADSLVKHDVFKKIGPGNIEHSLAWHDEDTGILLRSRPDYYNDNLILDVKTTKDASHSGFARTMFQYGYHRQAAMAVDGLSLLTGRKYSNVILFVVENKPPYLIKSYVVGEESLEIGRTLYKTGARIYAECIAENSWPGHPEVTEDLDIPRWAIREFEIDEYKRENGEYIGDDDD